MRPFIQYRKQITCLFAMAVILGNNRFCPFRQRDIDCSVRFLTLIGQSSVHDIGRRKICHVHKGNPTAQIGDYEYIVCQTVQITFSRTIRIDNLHHLLFTQCPFGSSRIELAHFILLPEWVFLFGNCLCLDCSVEHSPQCPHLKTQCGVFIPSRPHPCFEFVQKHGVNRTERIGQCTSFVETAQHAIGILIGIGRSYRSLRLEVCNQLYIELLDTLRPYLLFGFMDERAGRELLLHGFFRQHERIALADGTQNDLLNIIPIRTVSLGLVRGKVPIAGVYGDTQTFHRSFTALTDAEHDGRFSIGQNFVVVTYNRNSCFHWILVDFSVDFSRQPARQPPYFRSEYANEKGSAIIRLPSLFISRGDWIRTSDHTPPRIKFYFF